MKKLSILIAACASLAALVSCGGGDGSGGGVSESSTRASTGRATALAVSRPDAAPTTLGCQSRSTVYPWPKADMRTWTPANNLSNAGTYGNPGVRTGAPFQARLIQAYGTDTQVPDPSLWGILIGDPRLATHSTAIFEFADGCRRQYQVASFIPSDISAIKAAAPPPPPPDTATYSVLFDGLISQDDVDSGKVKNYSTQHFTLWYGTNTSAFSYKYIKSEGVDWNTAIAQGGERLEQIWLFDRDVIKAPMPYAGATNKNKINIYVCGTGLTYDPNGDLEDCVASTSQVAPAALFISARYIPERPDIMAHEFTHAIQAFTGGGAPASSIWETGANWQSYTRSPTADDYSVTYFQNLENGPLWSTSDYGAFPLMLYLYEKDNTRPFLWSTWTENLRDSTGTSTEDWVQTLVRLAQAAHVYPKGYESFADDMGWYGARLAAADFLSQKTMLDLKKVSLSAMTYAPLVATASSGAYTSPTTRPLLQWGTHIVPLTTTGSTVSVSLTGATEANSAAWRFTLVSVADDGTPRYASLGSVAGHGTANTSIGVVNGEKLYLVVTATPYDYESLGVQADGVAPTGTQFPYKVTVAGATPLTSTGCSSIYPGFNGVNVNWNTNGYTGDEVTCPAFSAPGFTSPSEVFDTRPAGRGSKVFQVVAPSTGPMKVTATGLVPASRTAQTVNTATAGQCANNLKVPQGAQFVRFQLFDADTTQGSSPTDLDLYVYDGPNGTGNQVASSTGDTTDEMVTLNAPVPGTYSACIFGYTTPPNGATTVLSTWVIGPITGTQTLKAGGPSTVYAGGTASITTGWSVTPGQRYLGKVVFSDDSNHALGSTIINVDNH